MVFHLTFVLVLFYDKICCNFINLFPDILWDLIVMSLVLSWWRLLKTVKIRNLLTTNSRVDDHARSWRVKCQVVFRQSFCDLANLRVTRETLCLDYFKCDSYTLHPYYIYPYYPQNCKEAIQKKTIKMFCGGTNLSLRRYCPFWE